MLLAACEGIRPRPGQQNSQPRLVLFRHHLLLFLPALVPIPARRLRVKVLDTSRQLTHTPTPQ